MHTLLLIAALTTQNFTLAKGWNALYFEVTPTENSEPSQVFSDPGISKVICYLPDAYNSSESYDVDGQVISAPPVSYRQWVRNDELLTDLTAVQGGMIYLVCATNSSAKISLAGDPTLPHFHWRKATQNGSGYAILAAPLLDADDTQVTVQQYFGEGPWNGRFQEAYRFLGTRKMPVAAPFPQAGYALVPGLAYGFTSERDVDWSGVVEVSGLNDSGITFDQGRSEVGFMLRNAGTTNRTISLSYKPAEGTGYLPVPLTEFAATERLDYVLAAGESTYILLHSDPTQRTAGGLQQYAGILEARDETGGTRMRVRFPVRAETVTDSTWPQGIYAGSFELNAVGITNVVTAAGGTVKGNLMMSVDKDGCPTLLQRLVFGQTNGVTVFTQDLENLPAEVRSNFKRFSSVTLDPLQPQIANSPRTAISAEVASVFDWRIAYDSPSNPYFHAWHPDHDGAEKLSDGTWRKVKSGDDFANYQSASKPELFSISNSVELTFTSVDWNANEALEGKISWKLFNLRANLDGPIECTGTFELKRVSDKERLE